MSLAFLAKNVENSENISYFAGAYHNKTGLNGQGLSDHMLFGSVVATTLVIVVTAQVKPYSIANLNINKII